MEKSDYIYIGGIIIILGLGIWIGSLLSRPNYPSGDIKQIQIKIDSLIDLSVRRVDTLKIIEQRKTEIKKYYEAKNAEIKTMDGDSLLVYSIREYLNTLGAAGF